MSKTETSVQQVARDAVAAALKGGAREAAATINRSRDVSVEWRDGKVERVSEATRRSLALQLYVDGRYAQLQSSDLRPEALATFIADGIAMTRVDGKNGLTCGMPIADQAVHWDRERALALLKYVKEDNTGDMPRRLCTPTGLPGVG